MNKRLVLAALVAALGLVAGEARSVAADKPPLVGPETEKRFPPLVVPEGFSATLFACDPLVEYPSVISLGPRPGTLFVAHDYVTGLGIEIVRRDEIRLITDTDGDGYADRSTLYAKGFNSIQGLAWHDGTVFVMHAPLLTSLNDTDGDGKADERHDLLKGLGLEPEKNNSRLHCANGVAVGYDGWLYLAMGDNGTDVIRPEGDRLLFRQGGILRCRPDGSDLHVFAGGLRNIYDVVVDDELNVFVRDNENDGGDYMIRVYHDIYGADHGYPYHYRGRRDLALGPLADLGRGSSAGGAFYGETAFPKAYRDGLFFCEWGSSIVFYPRQRQEAGFKPMREQRFASGAPTDPYGFKPTDLVVARDGSLYISDWADGQRPKRGRARIYRVAFEGARSPDRTTSGREAEPGLQELFGRLGSPSYHARIAAQARLLRTRTADWSKPLRRLMRPRKDATQPRQTRARMHGVWLLASISDDRNDELARVASSDPDDRVRVQAIRALADLNDPVLLQHRLDAGPGSATLAARLARIGQRADPRVEREVIIALGRLQWKKLPAWLAKHARSADPVRLHAGQQALRRCHNWAGVLKLLDLPDDRPARTMALRAVADRYDPGVVRGLSRRLAGDSRPGRRGEYAELLTRVWRKPAAWKYWGYRPAPRPVHPVAWEHSDAIATALAGALQDDDRRVRVTVLKTMRREGVPVAPDVLATWLKTERDPVAVGSLLEAIGAVPSDTSTRLLADVVVTATYRVVNRLAALSQLDGRLKGPAGKQLVELGGQLEAGPVLAELLTRLGHRDGLDPGRLLLDGVESTDAGVRAAAVTSLARRRSEKIAGRIPALLDDADAGVRRAAALAAGRLNVAAAADRLVRRAEDPDASVRAASLESLVGLKKAGATGAARKALEDGQTLQAGLAYLGEFGGAAELDLVKALGRTYRSIPVNIGVLRTFDRWQVRGTADAAALASARAEMQGVGGLLLRWHVTGPLTPEEATRLMRQLADIGWRVPTGLANVVLAQGTDPVVVLPRMKVPAEKTVRVAWTELSVPDRRELEFLAAAGGRFRVAINGTEVYRRDGVRGFQPDNDRFDATLVKGINRLVAWVDWNRPSRLQVRFREKTLAGVLETYAQRALRERGNAERGRQVFFDTKKRGLCIRCHRLGSEGERIGPDLTGVGRRFSRIHLVEAVLEPSRAIAPSYQTRVVVLDSGRVLTGVKVAETPTELTLGDKEGKLHVVPKARIEETTLQRISTMPDGVDKRLSQQEFIDLIAFLVSQQAAR